MRLSTAQLTFLARFSKSPDGQQVLSILRDKLEHAELGLRTATGEDTFRKQGRVLEIDELITDITGASAKITPQHKTRAQTAPQRAPVSL